VTEPPPDVAELRLTTPDDWWVLPLDAQTRHQAIARLVEERVTPAEGVSARATTQLRNDLTALLRRTAAEAAEAGGVFCASMVGIDGDAAVSANVLVLVRPIAATNPDAGATTDVAALAAAMRADPGPTYGDSVPEVDVVELPQMGEAVRVKSRRVASVSVLGREVPAVSVQYVVPLPGSPSCIVMTFTSPAFAYEDVLVELFDAIAATLVVG
jgi:hypothetical protein